MHSEIYSAAVNSKTNLKLMRNVNVRYLSKMLYSNSGLFFPPGNNIWIFGNIKNATTLDFHGLVLLYIDLHLYMIKTIERFPKTNGVRSL